MDIPNALTAALSHLRVAQAHLDGVAVQANDPNAGPALEAAQRHLAAVDAALVAVRQASLPAGLARRAELRACDIIPLPPGPIAAVRPIEPRHDA